MINVDLVLNRKGFVSYYASLPQNENNENEEYMIIKFLKLIDSQHVKAPPRWNRGLPSGASGLSFQICGFHSFYEFQNPQFLSLWFLNLWFWISGSQIGSFWMGGFQIHEIRTEAVDLTKVDRLTFRPFK